MSTNQIPGNVIVTSKFIPMYIFYHCRCPILDQSEYFSEESDIYTAYNSPASSCIDVPNVAVEVEM